MLWSKLFIPTLRENPVEAEATSHKLLLRAGYIRQLSAGIYSHLFLSQRALNKITAIVRQEMDAIGGQEMLLPALHPAEVWQESGRWDVMGQNMFRLKDRFDRDLCLGMTHEEVMTVLARGELRSYKQLPQIWYQIQTKFRDEPRPKSGLLRVRQFIMKDSYSFDLDAAGLDAAYEKHYQAYTRIFERCGLKAMAVEAHSGAMGGSQSHEFMVPSDAGEDLVAVCGKCGYHANLEKAVSVASKPAVADPEDDLAPEKFSTPGRKTILEVSEFTKLPPTSQMKSLVMVADGKSVLALLRGDHQLSETKFGSVTGAIDVRPAHPHEIREWFGADAGSLGPVGIKKMLILTDTALKGRKNMIAGANEDDHHLRNVTPGEDFEARFEDLRQVMEGDACIGCGDPLAVTKTIEIGHIFKLGYKYSESMGLRVLNSDGAEVTPIMGSYGIGVERILCCAIEQHNDADGMVLPPSIAPFQVVVTPVNSSNAEQMNPARALYQELLDRKIDVLLDDRDERPGVKFKDADLIGIPFRITVGKKIGQGIVELSERRGKKSTDVPLAEVVAEIASRLKGKFMRLTRLLLFSMVPILSIFGQNADAGRIQFESRCAGCHGGDAMGGERGPAIVARAAAKDDAQLAAFIRSGSPTTGMPGFNLPNAEMSDVVSFLRLLGQRALAPPPVRMKVTTTDGKTLEGLVLNKGLHDLQLQTGEKSIALLRKEGDRYRVVTSQTDWPSYNGQVTGNRYTTLDQIKKTNVSRLASKWIFSLPKTASLQVTPVVVEGIMYVTASNECYALDAGSGRQVWHYVRPRTVNLIGNAAGGVNRGVAISGDRLFMVTDNAHLIALDRFNGKLLWDTEMADWRQNYNATSAPLAVGNLVVNGSSGGDEGVRGFVAAFDQATGKEVWRFWTVPKPGEPGSETWKGTDINHPGGAAWFTGSYDPQLDTVYWPVGNPGADLYGDNRPGDNLYSSSMLALDAKTGKLKWYFQYTPHDVWDWDAVQTPVLVDTVWEGQPRKLLLHANRNGFFYVLDRTNGKMLRATKMVKKLSWATGIAPDGRPIMTPNNEPTIEGNKVCPSLEGATNWYSPSFNPVTGLFYVQTNEKCAIFRKTKTEWQAGKGYMAGTWVTAPGDQPQRVLRAFSLKTGAVAWELPEVGQGDSWGGTLSTVGGLVFFGDDAGALVAADGLTGKPLWQFEGNQLWKASPMTYMFDHKQYVAVASGPNIIAFALPE